ncbi:MAG: hypothetical protein HXY53_04180 [Nitrospirae bacterium]|nr:hypothetical protein [Nitrospirota bacterium]
MIQIILLLLIFLMPGYSEAAYKIYLKNGSVIPDVISYTEGQEEISIYFSTGSMTLYKKDIEKIEESEEPMKDFIRSETKETQETLRSNNMPAPSDEKDIRRNALQKDLDSILSEIRSLEEKESRLVTEINQKSSKKVYNTFQLRQLENEIEPLQKELSNIQQKKSELLKNRDTLLDELRTLQR